MQICSKSGILKIFGPILWFYYIESLVFMILAFDDFPVGAKITKYGDLLYYTWSWLTKTQGGNPVSYKIICKTIIGTKLIH